VRKQGIIFLVVLAGIIIAVQMIFSDRWIEKRMEKIGGKIVGARVEYDNVDFSLLGLSLNWDRLQVTNPDDTWKNMFETGPCGFNIAMEPLFKKKFIIDRMSVSEIRLNTDRETDGAIPKEPPKEKSKLAQKIGEKLDDEKAAIPALNPEDLAGKIDIESIWNSIELTTPDNIENLKDSYIAKFEGWEDRLTGLTIEEDIAEARKKLESIEITKIQDLDDIKGLEDIRDLDDIKDLEEVKNIENAVDTVKDIYETAKEYEKTVKQIVDDFEKDMQEIGKTDDLIKGWIEDDFNQIKDLLQLPDVSRRNIARILFGDKILARLDRVNRIMDKIRYFRAKLQRFTPKKRERPPRFEGQDIEFVQEEELPVFWIKTIEVSGYAQDQTRVSGALENVVAGQKIIDKPTTFHLDGVRPDDSSLRLAGTFDYRGDTGKELFSLDLENLPLRDIKLTDFALLPNRIARGDGAINSYMNFTGSDFEAGVEFLGTGIVFDYGEKPEDLSGYLYDITKSITEQITEIQFGATATYINDEFSLSLYSNLDDLIAEKMREIIEQEIEKAKAAIEALVMEQVDKYKKELEDLIEEKRAEIEREIAKYEEMVQGYLDEVEAKKKEVEKLLKKEEKRIKKKIEKELQKAKELVEEELRKAKEQAEAELQKAKELAEEELRKQQEALEAEKRRQEEALEAEKQRQEEELKKQAEDKLKKMF